MTFWDIRKKEKKSIFIVNTSTSGPKIIQTKFFQLNILKAVFPKIVFAPIPIGVNRGPC